MVAPISSAEPASYPVLENVVVTKLADGFKFTEGATADREGNVYFTDQPNDRIHKWSVDGKLSTFMEPAGRANGMCFTAQGTLIVCADEKTELREVAMDGSFKVLANEFEGKKLNGPNDAWVHPSGGIYLTDPFFKRPWYDYKERPQPSAQVYYLPPDRSGLKRVTEDLRQPNGLIGTPDGKHLFVADPGAKTIFKYDVQPDGSLGNKTPFCEGGSDGMTMDTDGRIYTTGKGVTVYDKTGAKIGTIPVPEGWVGNLCFSGPNRDILFIAASKGIYSVNLGVKGANAAK